MSEWISVKNRLPETPCFAYWSDGRYTVLDENDSVLYAVTGPDRRLTHWSPANPPEVKDNE
jgi:hypothetical protein